MTGNLTPDFATLVTSIAALHETFHQKSIRAINLALTLRNWMIGEYLHTYELQGFDRAKYGAQLFDQLALQLAELGIPRTDARELRRYRLFYLTYPHIRETVSPECEPMDDSIRSWWRRWGRKGVSNGFGCCISSNN